MLMRVVTTIMCVSHKSIRVYSIKLKVLTFKYTTYVLILLFLFGKWCFDNDNCSWHLHLIWYSSTKLNHLRHTTTTTKCKSSTICFIQFIILLSQHCFCSYGFLAIWYIFFIVFSFFDWMIYLLNFNFFW